MDETIQKVKKAHIRKFWIGRNTASVGGYSLKFDHKSEVADYVPNEKVVNLADVAGKNVALYGDWSDLGHEGFGEMVTTETARKLLSRAKLREEY